MDTLQPEIIVIDSDSDDNDDPFMQEALIHDSDDDDDSVQVLTVVSKCSKGSTNDTHHGIAPYQPYNTIRRQGRHPLSPVQFSPLPDEDLTH